MENRHLSVSGRVQGVGYRYAMTAAATRLGVSGWVRNRLDGTVEAMVSGEAAAVAAIIVWARQGPPGAQVTHVAIEIAEGAILCSSGFEARPTA